MNIREEKFSVKRIGLLLKRDVSSGYMNVLVIIGAIAALLLTFDILNFTIFNGGTNLTHHFDTFTAILFIGGFIATSSMFKEAHRRESAQGYLMLPASPLEKVFSRIVLSNLGWFLLTIVWYSVYTYLSAGVTELIANQHHAVFHPFFGRIWIAFAHYIVLQSIFLVGAVYFRKGQLFKTLLSLFFAGIAFSVFVMIAARIIFAPYFTGFFMNNDSQMIGSLFENLPFRFGENIQVLEIISKTIYWAVIAPVAWLITYVRFREVQIKDAV
jgi:hypothetical protein